MDKRLLYFVAVLLVVALSVLGLSIWWAANRSPQASSVTVLQINTATDSPTLVSVTSLATQILETPTLAATESTDQVVRPTDMPTVVPTRLPTIAPQAAATALNLYQPQLAAQGGDPNFRIVISAIGVDSGIATLGWHTESKDGQLAAVWDDPQYAVGYIISSAIPGNSGNTVMIGHNNIYGSVFRKLVELTRGAKISILFQGQQIEFTVAEVKVLKEKGATAEQKAATLRYFDPTPDIRLTLLSCWPETSNTHRVVVVAKP